MTCLIQSHGHIEALSAALEAQAFACGSGMAEMDQESLSRAAARALADAVVQAEVLCQSNGGEVTRACGFAQAEVEDIARAQVCLRFGNCRC